MARPFVALGNRLLPPSGEGETKDGLAASLLLGVATGFLWAPGEHVFSIEFPDPDVQAYSFTFG